MRKLLLFALMLGVLCLTQVPSPVHACHKNVTLVSTGDGDMIIETGEEIVWTMVIYVRNIGQFGTGGQTWTNVVVTDRFGAELEIDGTPSASKGTVDVRLTGKTEKVHLTWYIGDLVWDEWAQLTLTVSTDVNPGGQQEYSDSGSYELNSGAVVKFKVDHKQYSLELPSILIEVLPQS